MSEQNEKFRIEVTMEELRKRKLFVGLPMYGGMCLPHHTLIETEDGFKTIKEIVDGDYRGRVKSYSEEKGFVFSKVLSGIGRRNEGKRWVSLVTSETGTSRETLVCTDDHECSYVADVFDPRIEYKSAKDLAGGYIVREPSSVRGRSVNALFSKEQLSVVVGTLLGDSSVSKLGAIRMTHSHKQSGYASYKASILGGTVKQSIGGGFSPSVQTKVYVGANAQLKELHLLLQGGKEGIVKFAQYIDAVSLAFWYMDDGYLQADKRNSSWKPLVALCTDSFTFEEIEVLVDRLNDLGVKAKSYRYKVWRRIKIEDHDAFFSLIAPYIHEELKYKLPPQYQDVELKAIDAKRLPFGLTKVEGVKSWEKQSSLYDITVEDTHNFVANGFLVHNCHGSFARGLGDLTSLCRAHGIEVMIHVLMNESLIPRARNYIMDEFDRSGCSHMIFIDSDIGFNANDIIGMLAMMSDDSPYDVLGAPYAKKCISWEKIKMAVDKGFADEDPQELRKFVGDYVFNPTNNTKEFSVDMPVEMLEIGTGFMMIRRSAIELFKKAYPSLWFRPDHVRTEQFDGSRMVMAYFDCLIDRGFTWDDVLPLLTDLANKKGDIDSLAKRAQALAKASEGASRRYLSEDYTFCQLLRRAGGKVWLCPWMGLEHSGSYVFGGSLRDLARLGASPTADLSQLKKPNLQPAPKKRKKK